MNGFLFTSPCETASWCLMVVWRSEVSDEVFAESSQSILAQSVPLGHQYSRETQAGQTSQAGEVSGPRHSEKPRTSCVSSKLHTLNPSPKGSHGL